MALNKISVENTFRKNSLLRMFLYMYNFEKKFLGLKLNLLNDSKQMIKLIWKMLPNSLRNG